MNKKGRICFRWSVYLIDLGEKENNIQEGVRPCICVSNDATNTWSNIGHFIPLTSQNKNNLPVHYDLHKEDYHFLKSDSVVLTEQLTIQSTDNVIKFLGRLNNHDITQIKDVTQQILTDYAIAQHQTENVSNNSISNSGGKVNEKFSQSPLNI